LINSRYDLLENDIMNVVAAKIHRKIEDAKKQIKFEAMQK
jgi:hypothetical protein